MSIENVLSRIEAIKERVGYYSNFDSSTTVREEKKDNPQIFSSFKQVMEEVAKKEKVGTGFNKSSLAGKGLSISQSEGERISSLIETYAGKYNVDPALIASIIKAESNFNPKAVSSAGARGLMQLMPGTAKELGVANSFNEEENIEAGTRYFKGLLDRFGGKLELALAAYNAGPERVKNAGGIPNIKETKDYVSKVLRDYQKGS